MLEARSRCMAGVRQATTRCSTPTTAPCSGPTATRPGAEDAQERRIGKSREEARSPPADRIPGLRCRRPARRAGVVRRGQEGPEGRARQDHERVESPPILIELVNGPAPATYAAPRGIGLLAASRWSGCCVTPMPPAIAAAAPECLIARSPEDDRTARPRFAGADPRPHPQDLTTPSPTSPQVRRTILNASRKSASCRRFRAAVAGFDGR